VRFHSVKFFIGLLLMGLPTAASPVLGQYVRPNGMDEIDEWQQTVSRGLNRMTQRLDSFFADERVIEEREETEVQLTPRLLFQDGEDLTLKMSLSGRLAMPYLENRLLLFVETEGRERDVSDTLRPTPDVTEDDKSFFTGLRIVPKETRRTRISLDGGLRWYSGPSPFIRVRARKIWNYDVWDVRYTHRFFWFEARGFGMQGTLDFDRWLDERHFFRYSPSAIWSETSNGADVRQTVSVFHYLQRDRMIGAVLDIQGETHPSARLIKYEGTIRWRQRAAKRDWIYFEIAPGLTFPRENDFRATALIAIKFDLFFGNIKTPWGDSTIPGS
jgi:hypothetical protein